MSPCHFVIVCFSQTQISCATYKQIHKERKVCSAAFYNFTKNIKLTKIYSLKERESIKQGESLLSFTHLTTKDICSEISHLVFSE